MTALPYAVADSTVMLRRNLKRQLRYPSLTLIVVGIPIVFLLLFVYVFGGTLGAGLDGVLGGGRADYVNFVVPGILVLTIAGSGQGTAIAIAMDKTEKIIDRFRTMSISRLAVLTGHVLGAVLQTVVALVGVVAVALLVGFRPDADPVEWLATTGLLVLLAFGLTWLCIAAGLLSKTVEAASNLPMPLLLLPFFGSGFVQVESMPGPVRWFAEHQPFTPIIDTLRGLLVGTPIGHDGFVAVVWCLLFIVGGYLASRALYERRPAS